MTLFGKILLGLVLVVGVVLIVKGGAKKDDVAVETTDDSVAEEETSAENPGVFNGSMKDLLARGGSHKCTFSQEVDNSKSTGTVYISGKKMRGDFATLETTTNMNMESHMISDGEFAYVWSAAMPMGMKMKIDMGTESPENVSQGMDYDQKLDYSCEAWVADETKFSVPTEIKFSELPSQA